MEDYSSIYLIGDPVEHSISPQMHNAVLRQENLLVEYKSKQVKIENLSNVLVQFKNEKVLGFNVTIPLKSVIMKHLDEILPVAQDIGAVNTVKIENNKLIGTNTDFHGIRAALKNSEFVPGVGQTIVLIGAGGAARSVGYFFSDYKVNLKLVNRTTKHAEQLRIDLSSHLKNKASITVHSLIEAREVNIYHSADLIINTTPVGMWPHSEENILMDYNLDSSQWIFDLVYNPLETQLVKKARKAGCKIINGLDMLIYQAAEALHWWTGKDPDITLMRKVAEESLTPTSLK